MENLRTASLFLRPQSSALAHLTGLDDRLVKVTPLREIGGGTWAQFLRIALREVEVGQMQKHERTGRPLGAAHFFEGLEKVPGRTVMPKKAGRKPKKK